MGEINSMLQSAKAALAYCGPLSVDRTSGVQ